MSTQPQPKRNFGNIALLIDGDNASYKLIREVIEEVSRYGKITCRRVYGDWSLPQLAPWQQVMQENAIEGIHKWRSANGKNATDIDLVIDAMDILQHKTVHGFCIISSDSDFTGLCMKIRDEGLFVMGIGEKKTPKPFVNACDVFLFVEDIISPKQNAQPQIPPPPNPTTKNPKDAIDLLRNAFDKCAKEEGWVHLGALGQALYRLDTNFDSGTYGCNQLSKLIQSLPHQFIIREDKTAVRIKTQP